jgi:hypothetical protein
VPYGGKGKKSGILEEIMIKMFMEVAVNNALTDKMFIQQNKSKLITLFVMEKSS